MTKISNWIKFALILFVLIFLTIRLECGWILIAIPIFFDWFVTKKVMPSVWNVLTNKWVKFGIISVTYVLFVWWLGNWWWLLLIPVFFDIYITQKVHWAFWKKKGVKKQNITIEWIDALIFAVVAATLIRIFLFEAYTIPTSSMEKSMLVGDYLFVSKVAYGPKIPNTPLSVPFTHHTMPFTQNGKSYSELIKWPYQRLNGLMDIQRNDIVVFNFPAGDTVIIGKENPDYYSQIRSNVRSYQTAALAKGENISDEAAKAHITELFKKRFEIISRPVDKRENYVKRLVGLPGDTLELREGILYVNNQISDIPEKLQFQYRVKTNGTQFNKKRLNEKLNIAIDDIAKVSMNEYVMPLTLEMVNELKKYPNVVDVTQVQYTGIEEDLFPFSVLYPWNVDNFGPLYIPKKGDTVILNLETLPLYERIITVYEGNQLKIKDNVIYINDKKADTYTFQMDYFWMMGDNRHFSADSRYWGFVPEDHIVGKAFVIWLSLDKDRSFPNNIRWDRILKFVH